MDHFLGDILPRNISQHSIMQIIKGKIKKALRVVAYGSEGIGKSTFGSKFPNPVFIDTEGGSDHLDVHRTPKPLSWTALLDQVRELMHSDYRTIVIDTADWAEKLCVTHVCGEANKTSIEGFGFGKGYTILEEEFGKLLNLLNEVKEKGIHVVLLAHSLIRKFELPEEEGAFDRWEMKMSKKVSPLVKEWADMLLFANYETYVIEDEKTKSKKAKGGHRVMYTSHKSTHDAKNRQDLPEKLEFSFDAISHLFSKDISKSSHVEETREEPSIEKRDEVRRPTGNEVGALKPDDGFNLEKEWGPSLKQLAERDNVSSLQIRQAVASRGYYGVDAPIDSYDDSFVAGKLIAHWDAVVGMIRTQEFESIES